MKPLAPARLSMTTGCPVCSVTPAAIARAYWSVTVPAPKGTMKWIGLSGKFCAHAAPVNAKRPASSTRDFMILVKVSSVIDELRTAQAPLLQLDLVGLDQHGPLADLVRSEEHTSELQSATSRMPSSA